MSYAAPPATPYGASPWTSAPAKRSGKRARVSASLLAVLLIGGGVVRIFGHWGTHHLSKLPAVAGDLTESQDPTVQALLNSAKSGIPTGYFRTLKDLQIALYQQGRAPVVVEVGNVAAGSQKHAEEFFAGMSGTAELTSAFHEVTVSGSFGGSVRCANGVVNTSSSVTVCAWIDNGTFGVVMPIGADEPTALADLALIRSATEH
ncbi:MAG: hypothetical protein QOI76_3521 [Frankiales bacterium]|nr:hypothetical protein [Frankiales bacterium]